MNGRYKSAIRYIGWIVPSIMCCSILSFLSSLTCISDLSSLACNNRKWSGRFTMKMTTRSMLSTRETYPGTPRTRAYTHTHEHTHAYTHTHTDTHTHMNTHTHTHTHTHTQHTPNRIDRSCLQHTPCKVYCVFFVFFTTILFNNVLDMFILSQEKPFHISVTLLPSSLLLLYLYISLSLTKKKTDCFVRLFFI